MLAGRRTQRLLADMAEHYDYVVIDSAPILPVSDSLALSGARRTPCASWCRPARPPTEQIVETLERLDRVGAPVIGLVLNQAAKMGQVGLHLRWLQRLRHGQLDEPAGHRRPDALRRNGEHEDMTDSARFVRRNRVDERFAIAIAVVGGVARGVRPGHGRPDRRRSTSSRWPCSPASRCGPRRRRPGGPSPPPAGSAA